MNRMFSANLTPAIFLNYRREDTSGYAGRLFDWLGRHYANNRVFIDVTGIDPGLDFVAVIEQAVGSCEVLIALIGRHWLSITDEQGRRRLDNPEDVVRIEIATALTRNIRVIPVLVQGAAMPSQRDLPDALAKLARQNALELSDSRWSQDVQRLVEILGQVVTTRVEENAQKKAARLARVAERKRERESFLQSTEGIHAAQESLAEMFRYLEEQTSSIKQTPNAPRITLTAKDRFNCLVQGPHRGFRMTYFQEFNNTLEYSHLLVMEFRGLYSEDRGETFDIFRRVAVVFDLDDKSLPAWREKDAPDSFYTAKELGDRYLKRVLDSPKAAGFTKYRC